MLKLTIDHDQDCENPCKFDGWKVYSFLNKHTNYKHPSEVWTKEVQKLSQRNLAMRLDYFEHGEGQWLLEGSTNDFWDTSRLAGAIVWEDNWKYAPRTYGERMTSARLFLEVYSEWANGHCYYFTIIETDENGQEKEESVSDMIGSDSLCAAVTEALDGRTVDEIDGDAAFLWDVKAVC